MFGGHKKQRKDNKNKEGFKKNDRTTSQVKYIMERGILPIINQLTYVNYREASLLKKSKQTLIALTNNLIFYSVPTVAKFLFFNQQQPFH